MYITDNYGIFQPHSSNSMILTNDIIVLVSYIYFTTFGNRSIRTDMSGTPML